MGNVILSARELVGQLLRLLHGKLRRRCQPDVVNFPLRCRFDLFFVATAYTNNAAALFHAIATGMSV